MILCNIGIVFFLIFGILVGIFLEMIIYFGIIFDDEVEMFDIRVEEDIGLGLV